MKEFDLIIYGASGFTGRLVAEYLNSEYGAAGDLRWAMAGRSKSKLAQVRDEMGLPADTPLVVADTSDSASLDAMVARTKVVATTVGPYQLYGSDLVRACAEAGTDYVDLCGESVWMRHMIDQHSEAAQKSGARIVFSCGFDSIPFDLGVYLLQQEAVKRFGAPFKEVKGRVRAMKGTFSGGTAASLQESVKRARSDKEVFALAINPYALVPGFAGPEQPNGDVVQYSEELDSWEAPFIMAAINTRNIHRSNALMDSIYGEDFLYSEMLLTGPGEKGEKIAKAVAGDKTMAGPDAPKPGEGPSKAEREAGLYDVLFYGVTKAGDKIAVGVKGDRDPGYGSTCKLISESALCLLNEASDTPGGIWTTAPALGNHLINRLQEHAGVSFEIES